MIGLVKQLTGLDLRDRSVDDLADATRSETLKQTRNEKWGGRADPHTGWH
ncbi:MAG: hypothetical protein PHT19_09685 [Methylococcus sp.]|nr:hypothetical protein [Methylococcus sp.]